MSYSHLVSKARPLTRSVERGGKRSKSPFTQFILSFEVGQGSELPLADIPSIPSIQQTISKLGSTYGRKFATETRKDEGFFVIERMPDPVQEGVA